MRRVLLMTLWVVVGILLNGCSESHESPGKKIEGGGSNCVGVTQCRDLDGCCPTGCNANNDHDCKKPGCGDGVLNSGEVCDTAIKQGVGVCATEASCSAQTTDACEPYTTSGSACNITCQKQPRITQCISGDGCCPAGCKGIDDDCPFEAHFGKKCTSSAECGADGFCLRERSDDHFRDGYCTSKCIGNVCPAGAQCQTFERKSYCMKECDSNSDCREPHYFCKKVGKGKGVCTSQRVPCKIGGDCPTNRRCLRLPGDEPKKKFCWERGMGHKPVGAPCTKLSECSGGYDASCIEVPGTTTLVCSQECDPVRKHCPTGSHCTWVGMEEKYYCMKKCTDNDECASGLSCRMASPEANVKVCQHVLSKIGGWCENNDECENKNCLPGNRIGLRGGLCTQTCSTDRPCPSPDSICTTIHPDDPSRTHSLCLAKCLQGDICYRDRFFCQDTGVGKICWE